MFAFWVHERDLLVLSPGCCYMSRQTVSWVLQLPRCNLSLSLSLCVSLSLCIEEICKTQTRKAFIRKLKVCCLAEINRLSFVSLHHLYAPAPTNFSQFIVASIRPALFLLLFLFKYYIHLFTHKIKSTEGRFHLYLYNSFFYKGYGFFHQKFLFDIKQEAEVGAAVKCCLCVLCKYAFELSRNMCDGLFPAAAAAAA